MILEKKMNLSQKIQSELQAMKNLFGARLCGSIDITSYLFKKETLIEEVNILKKRKVREMKSLVDHLKKKEEEIVEDDESEESEYIDL